MPFATHSNQSSGGYEQAISQAGVIQVSNPEMPTPIPATIAGNDNWNSGVIYSDGYTKLSVGVTSSQTGSLVIIRYIDPAATVAQATSTTAIVASTALIVNLTDGLPFATFTIQVNNTTGSTATVTKFAVLMQSG